jgi:hypothetical protein
VGPYRFGNILESQGQGIRPGATAGAVACRWVEGHATFRVLRARVAVDSGLRCAEPSERQEILVRGKRVRNA